MAEKTAYDASVMAYGINKMNQSQKTIMRNNIITRAQQVNKSGCVGIAGAAYRAWYVLNMGVVSDVGISARRRHAMARVQARCASANRQTGRRS